MWMTSVSCVRQVWLPFHCDYSFPALVPKCCETMFDKVTSFSLHELTIAEDTANHKLVECIQGTTSSCYIQFLLLLSCGSIYVPARSCNTTSGNFLSFSAQANLWKPHILQSTVSYFPTLQSFWHSIHRHVSCIPHQCSIVIDTCISCMCVNLKFDNLEWIYLLIFWHTL